jgi:tetratricopeptide (TPR) repeat protein
MKNKKVNMNTNGHFSYYKKRAKWFWLFYILLVTLLLFILIPPIMGSAFRNIKVGDEVKVFTLKDIDGNEFNLEAHKGKIVVFNYFQLEKEKSQNALKALSVLYDKYKDKDVVFVAITSEAKDLEDIKKFKEENKIKFPILIDDKEVVYQSFGIFVMPITAMIDKEFKIIYEYSSFMMGFDSEVEGRIKVALGEMTMKEYEKSTEKTVIKERSKEEKTAVKKLGEAEVLLARGRPDKALKLLQEVVKLDPKIAKAHVLLGDAFLKKGKFDEAIKEYEEAKKLVKKTDPVAKTADVGIGAIYALKGEYSKAKKILSMSAMMNPNPITSGKSYYWLGFIDEKKGNLKSAVKNYKKAVEKLLSKTSRGH